MPTTVRVRNPIVALLGAFAIISAVALLGGRSGAHPRTEQPTRQTVTAAFVRDTAPLQPALHNVRTAPGGVALRSLQPSGGAAFIGVPVIDWRAEWQAALAPHSRSGENRPPLRILFCTWLN